MNFLKTEIKHANSISFSRLPFRRRTEEEKEQGMEKQEDASNALLLTQLLHNPTEENGMLVGCVWKGSFPGL